MATYRAFISYSHQEQDLARRLHARLETFVIPGDVASALAGQALGAVFLDEAVLGAAHDLSNTIRHALDNADALVLLASPAAAKSRWVNEEVIYFRAQKPDAPCLPIIARGRPDAGDADDQCYPPGLRFKIREGQLTTDTHDALGSDIVKDGEDVAFLKLVAGIIGADYEQLSQRHRKREEEVRKRQRRAFAKTYAVAARQAMDASRPDKALKYSLAYLLDASSLGRRAADGGYDDEVLDWTDAPELAAVSAEAGTLLRTEAVYTHLGQTARHLSFSPDGRYLAAAGWGPDSFVERAQSTASKLCIWDCHSHQVIVQFSVDDGIIGLRFLEGGRLFVATGGALKIFDAHAATEISTVQISGEAWRAVCNATGTKAYVTGEADGVRCIDVATGAVTRTWNYRRFQLKATWLKNNDNYTKIVLSPDDRLLAIYHRYRVRFHDAQTGRPVGPGWEATSHFGFDSTSKKAVLWNHTKKKRELVIVDPRTGKVLDRPKTDSKYGMLEFTAKGDRLVVTGDRRIELVALNGSAISQAWYGYNQSISQLAMSSGDAQFASSEGGDIRLWRLNDPFGRRFFTGGFGLFEPTNGWLKTLHYKPSNVNTVSEVRLWDVDTGQCISRRRGHKRDLPNLFRLDTGEAVSDDGTLFSIIRHKGGHADVAVKTNSNKTILCITLEGDKFRRRIYPYSGGNLAITRFIGGNRFLQICTFKDLRLVDIPSGKTVFSIHVDQMENVVEGYGPDMITLQPYSSRACPATDRVMLAVVGFNSLVLMAISTRAIIQTYDFGGIFSLDLFVFSPDGKRVAYVDPDSSVRIIDALSGEAIAHLTDGGIIHGESLFSMKFSPDGHQLCALETKEVRIWDVATQTVVFRVPFSQGAEIDFSPSGDQLAVSGEGWESELRTTVYDISHLRRRGGALAAWLCDRMGHGCGALEHEDKSDLFLRDALTPDDPPDFALALLKRFPKLGLDA